MAWYAVKGPPWLVCCKETAEGPRRGEGDHVGLRPWWSEKGYGEVESSCHVLSSSLHSFTHSSTHSFIHLLIHSFTSFIQGVPMHLS